MTPRSSRARTAEVRVRNKRGVRRRVTGVIRRCHGFRSISINHLGRDALGGDEGAVRDRHLLSQELLARLRVAADLALGRLGRAKGDEVHERPGVDRPVEFGVGAHRHDGPCELARDAELDEALVGRKGLGVDGAQGLPGRLGHVGPDGLERVRARLPHLRTHVLSGRDVEVVGRARVPHGELVEGADPVPEPFARDENRRADVEAEGVVLELSPVPVAHKKTDEALVGLVQLVLPPREAHPGGVDDGEVARHRAVEANEAVIEHLDAPPGQNALDDAHRPECNRRTGGCLASQVHSRPADDWSMGSMRASAACLLVLAALAAWTGAASAQPRQLPPLAPAANDGLKRAFTQGRLTEAQYALERARSLFRLGAVRREFGDVERPAGREATLILRDLALRLRELSGAERREAERLLARPPTGDVPRGTGNGWTADEATLSPLCGADFGLDANVCVHWVDTTADAPPPVDDVPVGGDGYPDQVNATLDVLETVWDKEIGELGYRAPQDDSDSQDDGGGPELDVYLDDIGADFLFGYCTTDDPDAENP